MRQTQFDGRLADIVGAHPHAGCEAKCLGGKMAGSEWGLVFQREDTGEEFFVFNAIHVEWKK